MKRIIIILAFVLLTLGFYAQMVNTKSSNGKYLDDAYYWPTADTILSAEPMYNRNAREFIFVDDTTQYADTVRMRIIKK